MAFGIVRDRALAEDVGQEAFLRAWRAAASYDIRRASVLTWMLTITRNAAIDAVRARRSVPTEDGVLEHVLQDTPGPAPDLQEGAVQRVETERAIRRLHRIAPEQARAVVLAVLGGCTAAEVARREQIPLGTAKTRIRAGLRRLREGIEVEHEG